jgi:hypothetical protein
MNSYELTSVISGTESLKKHCLGVFPADVLPSRLAPGKSIILNTDRIGGEGKHWVCFFRCPINKTVDFFDSFGRPCQYYHKEWLSFVQKNGGLGQYNDKTIQSVQSVVCGLHCLSFLLFRANDVTLKDYVNRVFTKCTILNDIIVEAFVEDRIGSDLIEGEPAYIQTCQCKTKHRFPSVGK